MRDAHFKAIVVQSSNEDDSRAEKTEKRAKDNKTVKTKLVLIVYSHHPKNANTNCFNFLRFKTEKKVI
jgi:hypothetical protein